MQQINTPKKIMSLWLAYSGENVNSDIHPMEKNGRPHTFLSTDCNPTMFPRRTFAYSAGKSMGHALFLLCMQMCLWLISSYSTVCKNINAFCGSIETSFKINRCRRLLIFVQCRTLWISNPTFLHCVQV